jgi:hypothetical protein
MHDFGHAFIRTANIANASRNSKGENKKRRPLASFSISAMHLFADDHLFG